MSIYLKPHSQEWFKFLETVNPKQASHTRKILSMVGRDDVCSICGDDPAPEYKLAGKQDTEIVATFRLCKDCIKVREIIHEERYVPLTR